MHTGFPMPPKPTLGAPNLFIQMIYSSTSANAHKRTSLPSPRRWTYFTWQRTLCCTSITLPAKRIHMTCTHSLKMLMKCPIKRLHQWQQMHCRKDFACNPTQHVKQHCKHECCASLLPPQPQLEGIHATLQARMDVGSQCSLPTMFWLVCHQVQMHFGRRLWDQSDGNDR